MQRQRNVQKVKEHGENPPDQTNEEEIKILPEKEFRTIILQLIQNLENKTDAWINRQEAWIKMV